MPLTKAGEECQTCGYCSQVGPHFPHDCDCDWRTYGHLDPEDGGKPTRRRPSVDIVDTGAHTSGMTQTKNLRTVPAAEVTEQMIATDRDFVVITPSGRRIGDMPSLSFGLGSWDGDTAGFAAWLREQA